MWTRGLRFREMNFCPELLLEAMVRPPELNPTGDSTVWRKHIPTSAKSNNRLVSGLPRSWPFAQRGAARPQARRAEATGERRIREQPRGVRPGLPAPFPLSVGVIAPRNIRI